MRLLEALCYFIAYGLSGAAIWFLLLKWHWIVRVVYHG